MKARRWRCLLSRWLKFSAVGWLGVGVQLAVLTILAGHLGLHYLVATVLAVESAIVHNFFWHEQWTWGDRGLLETSGRLRRLLRFNVAAGSISLVGNLVFMSFFVGQLNLHYLVGNMASIAACAVLSFIINDRVVFIAVSEGRPVSCR